MPRRKPAHGYHHRDLRRALIGASLQLLGKGGVEALSLREAARRAGVSSGAPYHHFPTRAALLAAIAAEGFHLLLEAMQAELASAPGGDRIARFLAVGRGYVRFGIEHPAHFQTMFRPLGEPGDFPALREAAAPVLDLLVGGIRGMQERGVIPAGDPTPYTVLAWASVHGAAELAQRGAVEKPLGVEAGRVAASMTTAFGELLGRPLGRGSSADTTTLDVRPVVLEGSHVRLEPLSRDHLDGIIAAGSFDEIWTWISVRPAGRDGFARFIDDALAARDAGTELPFTTFDRHTGEIVGGTRYLDISHRDRRLEIGWTWITPSRQRTAVNTEAKYLQLRHCFEVLGCRRVQLKTDARNAKSRAAMLRIGALFEGIAPKHMLTQGGANRDTAWFAVIDDDWPAVKARLEGMLRR